MPAPLVAVGTLLLQALPGIVSAVSDLVKSIREKRGAREIASDAAAAVSQLVDVASAAASDLPADSPLREVLALTGQLTEIMADGQATPDELRALGERLVELGAACLAAAQDGPQEATTAAPAPAAVVLAAGTAKRRQARMHARPMGQGRKPIHPSALVASKPQPPAVPETLKLPSPWPFGRPPIPGRDKPPGGTLPEPPVDTRPPRVEIDDETGEVPPPVDPLPTEPVVDGVEVPPPATEAPAPYVIEPGVVYTAPRCHGDGLVKIHFEASAWMSFVDAVFLPDCTSRGWSIPLELALSHINALERALPHWLFGVWTRGLKLAVREEHGQGRASAEAAWDRLVGLGIEPLPYLGSCANPEEYIGSRWRAVLTGAKPGHKDDGKWDGAYLVASGLVAIGTGTAESIASGIKMSHSKGAWWGHPVAAGAATPGTGAPPYFWTPGSTERPNHAASPGKYIVEALEGSIAEVAEAGGEVRLVSVLDLADIAARANFPPTWDMEKS